MVAFAKYLDRRFGAYGWCHVANEGSRGKVETIRLKRQGMKTGFPDVLVLNAFHENDKRVAVLVEMKRRRGGRTTRAQRKWAAASEAMCIHYFLARGCEEAMQFMENYQPYERPDLLSDSALLVP